MLNSPERQAQFDADGFTVVKSFLSSSDVDALIATYYELENDISKSGFHASCYSSDIKYRETLRDRVFEIFTPSTESALADCRPISADYVIKEAGQGKMPMHQDWSRVDEREHRSVTIWCPLEDTHESNGMLSVLRESHRNIIAWRGESAPGIPGFFPQFENHISSELKEAYGVALPLKAGDAVIYDTRLVHYSPDNLTDRPRLAVNVSLAPAEAPLIHSYRSSLATIDLLEVDPSFFVSHPTGSRPTGKKVGEIPYSFEIRYPELQLSLP